MLKIRLQRVGKKNAPSFRVVLAEHKSPPQGKFQEILGFYNPRSKERKFKGDRIKYWISIGAQLSPTVYNLLIDEGILSGTKLKAWRPKKIKKEAPTLEKVGKELKEEESKEEGQEEAPTPEGVGIPTSPKASVGKKSEKEPKEEKKEKNPEQGLKNNKQKEN